VRGTKANAMMALIVCSPRCCTAKIKLKLMTKGTFTCKCTLHPAHRGASPPRIRIPGGMPCHLRIKQPPKHHARSLLFFRSSSPPFPLHAFLSSASDWQLWPSAPFTTGMWLLPASRHAPISPLKTGKRAHANRSRGKAQLWRNLIWQSSTKG
jgi:hypothetical protein